jgi:uncharacterized membrane protein YphA (DoxX/SURF4 family)
MFQRISVPRLVGLFYVLGALFFLIRGITVADVVDEFNIYWMFTFSALFLGVLLSINQKSEHMALYISRVFVGVLFIVSGLIKANDTLGFSFKLEEYFREDALGWTVFQPHALFLSVLVSAAEVMLGLAVLIGAFPKLSSWLLLLMTIFFGWLTYYTAECNDAQYLAMKTKESFSRFCVTDCGCFGDALRGSIGRSLTPWESFYKDLTLFFFVFVIFIKKKTIELNDFKKDLIFFAPAIFLVALFAGGLFSWHFPAIFTALCFVVYMFVKKFTEKSKRKQTVIAFAMGLMSFGFAFITLNYLPNKDFLPYAVENDLKIEMSTAEELGLKAPVYAYEYTLVLPSGEKREILSTDYMAQKIWEDEKWKDAEIQTGGQIKIEDGEHEPTITDLHFETPYSLLEKWQLEDPKIQDIVDMEYDPGYVERFYVVRHAETSAEKMVSASGLAELKADSLWAVVIQKDSVISEENNPLIDVTSVIFNQGYWIWFVSYSPDKAGEEKIAELGRLAVEYKTLGIPINLSAPLSAEQILALKKKYTAFNQLFYGDGTELKRVVRSNPGIVLMKGSVVVEKWHYNARPSSKEIQSIINK